MIACALTVDPILWQAGNIGIARAGGGRIADGAIEMPDMRPKG
jgi:hypothetical protein